MAALAWDDRAIHDGISTHDVRMKRAQLGNYAIAGSIILVDEAQDMDACQIEFCFQNQVRHGKIIYVVGDPAQTIYGFRGAKAQNLMKMHAISMPLTQTWRFGPDIARIANVILYAKERSPQSKIEWGRNKYWDPYRIRAGRQLPGTVTDQRVAEDWPNGPVTIIGRFNISLLVEALALLGLKLKEEGDVEDDEAELVDDSQEWVQTLLESMSFPKIHLYGKRRKFLCERVDRSRKTSPRSILLVSNQQRGWFHAAFIALPSRILRL
mmetsp:Transcript_14670/g.35395  ORF Transcript_14670/g.35395 Transcript_14670/m.35395 type:complete len:267 (+) Transcript_14670:1953-2753(+)